MRLLSFFLIFGVFILAFALFDYVVYGLVYEPNSSVLRSLVLTFRGSLGELDFDNKYEIDTSISVIITCLSAFLLVILLLNLLIAVMNEAYEEIKQSAEARWCYMQFRHIAEHHRSYEETSPSYYQKILTPIKRILCCFMPSLKELPDADLTNSHGLNALRRGKSKSKVCPEAAAEGKNKEADEKYDIHAEDLLLRGMSSENQGDLVRQQQKLSNILLSKRKTATHDSENESNSSDSK